MDENCCSNSESESESIIGLVLTIKSTQFVKRIAANLTQTHVRGATAFMPFLGMASPEEALLFGQIQAVVRFVVDGFIHKDLSAI